jgi:hydroxylamine reductase
MSTEMFCRQCEQTVNMEGCTVVGVCGKQPDVAVLQDLLIYSLKGIGVYGKKAREMGVSAREVDTFVKEGLFTTVTNVNFDPERLERLIRRSYEIKEKAKKLFLDAYKKKEGKDFSEALPDVVNWKPADTREGLIEQGEKVGIMADPNLNEDVRSLREILLYGLKGMAAYADHAAILGEEDETLNSFFYKGLASLVDDSLSGDDLVGLIMEFGGVNLKCMEILDRGHNKTFGSPVPTPVALGVKKGPAIIISGHDLPDLKQLLEQTEGTGINIYTHSEMLPAHGYPELKKYKHLAGHFGTAWQNQQNEFNNIPAAILMTTNCIQKPRESYKDRIFTTGLVAWPNVTHIEKKSGKKDFSKVIAKAKELGGFKEDKIEKEILVGFGHNAVLGLADKIIAAVTAKNIRHFFLIGGCDGAKPGRNYYTEFAKKVPDDCMILTRACGKFRFNNLDFGTIGEFPRLLDVGQCNDAYSAIKIAVALAEAFECGVNDLPLSLVLSWYEQKAVCILLTLLSLNIQDIRIGPALPAFVSPNVLKVLVEKFNLKPISTPDEDLKAILG